MTMTLSPVLTLAARGLRWWASELTEMLPARLRPAPPPALRIGDGRVEVGERSAPRADDAAVRRLLSSHRVVLRLGPGEALRLAVALPAAAEANLAELLGFEIERRTPFRLEDVLWRHEVLRRDAGTRRLLIDLVLVPRRIVDPLLVELKRLGLACTRIETADGVALPLRTGRTIGRRARMVVTALVLVGTGLAATGLLLPLSRQTRLAVQLETRAAAASVAAEQVVTLRNELHDAAAEEARLFRLKERRPAAVVVIDALSRLLPDDTWLLQLQMNDGEVALSGFSTAAAQLVPLIEDSPMFRDAAFRSPVTQDSRSGTERFHISARLQEVAP